MIKFLIKTFLILFIFFSSFSFSDTTEKIEVIGNKRISNETIIVLSQLNNINDFNDLSLNDALKKLYETNFFKDVIFKKKQDKLIIQVVENPIIENIKITGIKKESLKNIIYDTISSKNRNSFTEINLRKDVDLINNILKSNGYYFSKIKTTLNENKELNSVELNIKIELGEKARIKNIIFLGNKKFKDKKLLELIASEEHKFWKFLSKKVFLNQSLINLDKRLLEKYYKNNGYYNVKILNSFAELDKNGSFKLIYNIEAGEKFYFNNFSLILPEDYNKNDFHKIYKIFKDLNGKYYSLNNLNLILKEIERIASLKLYDFIDAEISEVETNGNKLNFAFQITDSEKFYVEKINIFGNFNTIEEVVRNKFIVDEGDPYNKILFNKSINDIKSLGIFKKVDAEINQGSTTNSKIVNVNVEEQPTGEVSLGAGYGTTGGVIGGGLKEKNFLGKGIVVDSNLQLTSDSIKGSITYSKPNFNYSDNTLFTSIKSTSQDNLTTSGYKVSTKGFSLGTKFEQFQNLFFRPEIDFETEDLTTNSNASSTLRKQEGSYNDFYFNYSIIFDDRDNSFDPSSGKIISFFQEAPILSTNKDLTNTFIYTTYKTLNERDQMVGKLSFYLKTATSFDEDVRISKRPNIPYRRLRGFERGKIGPLDNSDYIGGNYVSAFNLSTNLPGLLSSYENLDFSYFIDLANVWGVDYSDVLDNTGKIRSSTGISLDYLSPIGPLSFSWSLPISKESSDKTETFRFNLGTTF
tara:strand:- start:1000 stop:3249 length:2250 start_codon:yes stop_codon:yes gene_type:complete